MKKFLPFALLFAGVFAMFGVLFLLVRTDALPLKVRMFDWRKAVETMTPEAAEEEAV